MAKLLTEEEYNALLTDAERWRYIVEDGKSMNGKFTLVECWPDGNIKELHGGEYSAVIDKARKSA